MLKLRGRRSSDDVRRFEPASSGKVRLLPTAGPKTGYEPPVTFPLDFDWEGSLGEQEGEPPDWGVAEGSRDPDRPGRTPAKQSGQS